MVRALEANKICPQQMYQDYNKYCNNIISIYNTYFYKKFKIQ